MPAMTSFLAGAADFLAGFGLVLRVPAIRRWAVIPMFVNALVFGTLLFLLLWFSGDITTWIAGHAKSAGGRVLHVVFQVLLILIGFGVVVILALLLANAIAAPFYTKLAEATLHHLTGRVITQPGSWWRIAILTIGQQLLKIAIFIGFQAILLGIAMVPIAGPIVALGVTFLLLAVDFADFALEAYDHGVVSRYQFAMHNAGRAAGFGSGVFLTTLVPGLNILTAPAAVAGAARMVATIKGQNVR